MDATRLGALDYVTKPFRVEELRSRLERAAHAVELSDALDLLEHRLVRRQLVSESIPAKAADEWHKDFAEVLRHELNNPLTGILGNAELLLAEIARKKDGKLPYGGLERVEAIAALAMRRRETVRQLSHEWKTRNDPLRQT